jgi:hypothetical protein
MRLKLGAAVLVATLLASCSPSSSSTSSSLSNQRLAALDDARARLRTVETALEDYSRAIRFLFFRMEDPHGPNGKPAIRRVSQALKLADRSAAAAADLTSSLSVRGLLVKESTETMLAAWRLNVPRIKATLAGHKELSCDEGMNLVDEAHDAVTISLGTTLLEADILYCEASGGYWDEDGGCTTG